MTESGIVFPPEWGHVLVAGSPNIGNELTILKRDKDVLAAKMLAEAEYILFFLEWHPYIRRCIHVILRERYAATGQVGYLIRVTVAAPERKIAEIKAWADEHIRSDRIE